MLHLICAHRSVNAQFDFVIALVYLTYTGLIYNTLKIDFDYYTELLYLTC